MRGVPQQVLEHARKVAACIQEMNAVQIKHGFDVECDYTCGFEVSAATERDIEFLKSPATNFSFVLDGKPWYCVPFSYETGRRLVSSASFHDFLDGEPYANHPEVQWEWMDGEAQPAKPPYSEATI